MDNYPEEFTDLQKRPNEELQGINMNDNTEPLYMYNLTISLSNKELRFQCSITITHFIFHSSKARFRTCPKLV